MKKKTIGIVFMVVAVLFGCAGSNWTLIVCESEHFTGGCAENKYVLKGYSSQKECMEKGLSLNLANGFECGRSCRDGSYGAYVCDEICNERGCH